MKQNYLLLTLLFAFPVLLNAQTNDTRLLRIQNCVEGINTQNNKLIQDQLFWLGKVLVSNRMLNKEFNSFRAKFGKTEIDTIYYSGIYEATVKLKTEKSSRRIYMRYIFSDNGKVMGFGFGYPPFIYSINTNANILSDAEIAARSEELIQKYYTTEKDLFNGSIMISSEGKSIYTYNQGKTKLNEGIPITDTTLFELASCSKQFTALSILMLEKRGLIKLNDKLTTYFPSFPYPDVTIQNLLNHTSGLPDYEALLEKTWDKSKFATNEDALDVLIKYHPKTSFAPNEQFEYSNTGYMLLSSLIAKVSGQSYNTFLDSAIFKPLGMKHTRVYNTRRFRNEVIPGYAYGYVKEDKSGKYMLPDSIKSFNYVIYQDPITGDGTVNSCLADLKIWENELINPKVLDKEMTKQLFTDQTLNNGTKTGYGMGFMLTGDTGGQPLAYHTGGWPGYVTLIMLFPNLNKSITILCNNNYENFAQLADELAAIVTQNN